MPEPGKERHPDTADTAGGARNQHVPRVRFKPVPLQSDNRQHCREPGGADRHRLAGADPFRPPHQVRGRDARLLRVTAPLRLADPPTGQNHRIARLELRRIRPLDGAGEIDAGDMRVITHQPADPLQDHPILVI
jgi:hypothetical protein